MGNPDEAAHVLGKLLVAFGPERILWGTDSIWYGSPQDQIAAFRSFEITPAFQEQFGYPALTPDVKERILGANAVELFGITPPATPCPPVEGLRAGPTARSVRSPAATSRDVPARAPVDRRRRPLIRGSLRGRPAATLRRQQTLGWGAGRTDHPVVGETGDRYRDRRMFVKICGITNEDDALLAVAMGADAVGFVFAPSPRQIAVQQAYDITRRLPPEILTVGVFRDEHPKRAVDLVHRSGVKAAQLHGNENADVVAEVARSVKWVIKAYPAGSAKVAEAGTLATDLILLDAASPGLGQLFDWTLAGEVPDERAPDPGRRARPRQRRRRRQGRRAVGRRRVERGRAIAGQQGCAQGQALHRAGQGRRAGAVPRRRRAALRLERRVTRRHRRPPDG